MHGLGCAILRADGKEPGTLVGGGHSMHTALSSLEDSCRILRLSVVVEKYAEGRSREKGATDA